MILVWRCIQETLMMLWVNETVISLCMCVCVCVCVCVHVCVHTCMRVCVCVCVWGHVCMWGSSTLVVLTAAPVWCPVAVVSLSKELYSHCSIPSSYVNGDLAIDGETVSCCACGFAGSSGTLVAHVIIHEACPAPLLVTSPRICPMPTQSTCLVLKYLSLTG